MSDCYGDSVAEGFCNIVKRLSRVQRFGGELTRQETNHLEILLPELRKRLIEFGLIEGKIAERVPTVERSLDAYRKTRTNLKESSQTVDTRIFHYLEEHFGKRKRIDLIAPVEAAGIKHYLVNERTAGRGKLKPSSANRAISAIKPVFQFAIDCGYLTVSPFAKVKGGKSSSPENVEYISLQYIEDAFVPCGNHLEYRCLLAFARYENSRVPSEIRDLKFSDFRNFETGIIFTVPDSGKTGKRQVPVFKEFLPYLEELQKHRKEGQVELFEHCRKGTNVGTLIKKQITKAGLPLWKKFFTNLRSSCITDKDKTINNVYRMNAIFGNSEQIRLKHYRQPDTDAEYAALGGLGEKQEERQDFGSQ